MGEELGRRGGRGARLDGCPDLVNELGTDKTFKARQAQTQPRSVARATKTTMSVSVASLRIVRLEISDRDNHASQVVSVAQPCPLSDRDSQRRFSAHCSTGDNVCQEQKG